MTRFRTYRIPSSQKQRAARAPQQRQLRQDTIAARAVPVPVAELAVGGTPAPADSVDVCAFLYAHCKTLQHTYLDPTGITFLFDVDSGRLPRVTCESLAELIGLRARALSATARGYGGTITITLRHRAPMWALAVADSFVPRSGPRFSRGELDNLKVMAQRVGAAYMIQPGDDGATMALLFGDCAGVLSDEALLETRSEFCQ